MVIKEIIADLQKKRRQQVKREKIFREIGRRAANKERIKQVQRIAVARERAIAARRIKAIKQGGGQSGFGAIAQGIGGLNIGLPDARPLKRRKKGRNVLDI